MLDPTFASLVAVADAGSDTTCWVMLATSQTGVMQISTDGGLTYNASTNVLTADGFAGATGTAGLSFGTNTGDTTLPTGSVSYTGASNKTLSLVTAGASGTITFTAGAAAFAISGGAASSITTTAGAITLDAKSQLVVKKDGTTVMEVGSVSVNIKPNVLNIGDGSPSSVSIIADLSSNDTTLLFEPSTISLVAPTVNLGNSAAATNTIVFPNSGTDNSVVSTSGNLAFDCRMTTTDAVASGTAKVIGGLYYSQTAAGTALTGTANETVLGTFTLKANTVKLGTVWIVHYSGRVTANVGATTLTIRLRVGPTTLTGTIIRATAAVDTASGDIFNGRFEFASRGAPGASVDQSIIINYTNPGAAAAINALESWNRFGLATNGDLLVEVTGQWSAADGNSCQLEVLDAWVW